MEGIHHARFSAPGKFLTRTCSRDLQTNAFRSAPDVTHSSSPSLLKVRDAR